MGMGIVDPFDTGSDGIVDPLDTKPEPAVPLPRPRPNIRGTGEAFGRGAAQGATAGFYDELRGATEAGGTEPGKPMSLGEVAKGIYRTMTGDEEAQRKLEEGKRRERKALEESRQQHPYATGAGEFTGAVGSMAALPGAGVVKGTGLLPNMGRGAIAGGEYGALQGAGEGEGLEGRATGAGTGAATGIVGGAAAPIVGTAAGAAYNKFGRPIVNTVRGWIAPEQEAARRLSMALEADAAEIAAGRARGMSPSDWFAARAKGDPVTLADLGAGNTQALLRSAANTTPEGRAIIEKIINERFAGQGERFARDIRGLVRGGANAGKTQDQLLAEYDLARTPAYAKAFAQPGAQSLWNEGFEQISQAPIVQQAIRAANITAKDDAARMGLTPPGKFFSVGPDGRFTLSNPDLKPNLQYWDVVKKNLDRMGTPEAKFWSKTLRDHIDPHVPEYADARGLAAKYFGERDALQAGKAAAGKNIEPAELAKVFRGMDDAEKDLFREGWASAWADRVGGETSVNTNVAGKMFAKPNDKIRANIVFGPANVGKIEARINVEKIYDAARTALGNSTTARQLIEAGLAGGAAGAAGGYALGMDWRHTAAEGFGFGTAARLAPEAAAAGARKLIGYVDRSTAKKVAELLTSDDPRKLAIGVGIASRDKRVAEGLRAIVDKVTLATQSQALPAQTAKVVNQFRPYLSHGTVPAAAEPEQNKRYGGRANQPDQHAQRVPHRASGGRVTHFDPKSIGARKNPRDGNYYLPGRKPGTWFKVVPRHG